LATFLKFFLLSNNDQYILCFVIPFYIDDTSEIAQYAFNSLSMYVKLN